MIKTIRKKIEDMEKDIDNVMLENRELNQRVKK